MPLIRVQASARGAKSIFVAAEPIGHMASVYIYPAPIGEIARVAEGTTAQRDKVAGVAIGEVASGELVRVLTHGYISGVICGNAVKYGDRLTTINITSGGGLCSGAGKVASIENMVSGALNISGWLNLAAGTLVSGATSGRVVVEGTNLAGQVAASGIGGWNVQAQQFLSGSITGILGKALASGGMGSGIPIMVTLGI